jgi:CheY-like chemotaxis protein
MTTRFSTIGTLIVDDSEVECELLSAQLRQIDSVRVIGFAHDGMEAIAYMRGVDPFSNRTTFPYPELMLLDYKMPRCNGMQVLDFLRREPHRPRVVLWSNALDESVRTRALSLGADLVCAKPGCLEDLEDIIRRLEANVFKRIVNFVSWKHTRGAEASMKDPAMQQDSKKNI